MGLHPIPRISRAKPAAAAIRRKRHQASQPLLHVLAVIPKAAGVSGAPPAAAHPSDAHAAQVCFVLGSPRASCHATCQRLRGSCLSPYVRHLSRRATPCLSALPPLRQAVKAVGHYAQGLSGLADLAAGRSASASPGPSQGARYGSSQQRRLSVLTMQPIALQGKSVHTETRAPAYAFATALCPLFKTHPRPAVRRSLSP